MEELFELVLENGRDLYVIDVDLFNLLNLLLLRFFFGKCRIYGKFILKCCLLMNILLFIFNCVSLCLKKYEV